MRTLGATQQLVQQNIIKDNRTTDCCNRSIFFYSIYVWKEAQSIPTHSNFTSMSSFVRKLFSSPSFERELGKAIQHEMGAMESLSAMAPKVYSYQHKAVASTGGAFAHSKVAMRQVKVDKPVINNGLFHH